LHDFLLSIRTLRKITSRRSHANNQTNVSLNGLRLATCRGHGVFAGRDDSRRDCHRRLPPVSGAATEGTIDASAAK
jgi:hypothetical protein